MDLKRAIGGSLLSVVFLLFFTYIIFGVQSILGNSFPDKNKEILLGSVSDGLQNVPTKSENKDIVQSTPAIDPGLEVGAKSAISIESNLSDADKIIFEKSSDTKLPIASLTKLMTAIVVLDNYNLSDAALVDKVADAQDPVKQDVKLGDRMPVENFLETMLVGSSNKSAYALSELIGEEKFVALMNHKAKDLGLADTFFADPTGLSSENVSTARDLAKLAEYILKNYPKISDISRVKAFTVPNFGTVTNTDQLLGEIPEIVCSKTGFTTAAKGCLLLVINNPKNKDYLISVILGADDRFLDMKNLINWSSAICN